MNGTTMDYQYLIVGCWSCHWDGRTSSLDYVTPVTDMSCLHPRPRLLTAFSPSPPPPLKAAKTALSPLPGDSWPISPTLASFQTPARRGLQGYCCHPIAPGGLTTLSLSHQRQHTTQIPTPSLCRRRPSYRAISTFGTFANATPSNFSIHTNPSHGHCFLSNPYIYVCTLSPIMTLQAGIARNFFFIQTKIFLLLSWELFMVWISSVHTFALCYWLI